MVIIAFHLLGLPPTQELHMVVVEAMLCSSLLILLHWYYDNGKHLVESSIATSASDSL